MSSLKNEVILMAFDREFPLPRNNLIRSKTLSAGLSGSFSEQNEIQLNLDEKSYPAFLIIYEYLLDPKKNFIKEIQSLKENPFSLILTNPLLSFEMINHLLLLADYLIITELIDLFFNFLTTNNYTRAQILSLLIEFAHIDNVVQIKKVDLLKDYLWNRQSKEVKNILKPLFNQDPEKQFTLPLAFHLTLPSIDKIKLLSIMPKKWAHICQKDNRPVIIKDWTILPYLIHVGKKFSLIKDKNGKGHYIMGPGRKELSFRQINGRMLPYCDGFSELPSLDQRWGSLRTIITPHKWVALIDPKCHGDFTLIWRPCFVPELQLIVDLASI